MNNTEQKKRLETANAKIEREKIQKEINSHNIPKNYNLFEKLFKKTMEEKIALANAKMASRRDMRKNGFNPNTRMNTSEPIHVRVW